MDAKVYRAALKGSWEELNLEPWEDQLTPLENTVLHVHVGRPPEEGEVNIEFMKSILNQGVMQSLLWHENANKEIPLQLAARFGHAEAVEEILRRVNLVNEEEVRRMLRKTNKRKDTALHEAARAGYDQIVRLLVNADLSSEHKANYANETPFYLAAESGSSTCVATLVEDCDSSTLKYDHKGPSGRTALHAAVRWGNPDMALKIVNKYESLIRIQDDWGLTPLHYAAVSDKLPLLLDLLNQERTAIYIRDNEGRSPLHFAVLDSNWDAVKEIIACCPDCVEIVDNKGQNAVHYAASLACVHQLEHFLDLAHLGSLMNENDLDGNTPLHLLAAKLPDITCGCLSRVGHFMRNQQLYVKLFNNKDLTPGDIIVAHSDDSLAYNIKVTNKKSAPRGGRTFLIHEPEEVSAIIEGVFRGRVSNIKKFGQSHLVVAALVATVSFAACFTVPGGYNQRSDPNPGMAVMSEKSSFQLFLIFDSFALAFSSTAVFMHFFLPWSAQLRPRLFPQVLLLSASVLCGFSVVAMIIAFAMGLVAITPYDIPLIAWILFHTLFVVVIWFAITPRELAGRCEAYSKGPFRRLFPYIVKVEKGRARLHDRRIILDK